MITIYIVMVPSKLFDIFKIFLFYQAKDKSCATMCVKLFLIINGYYNIRRAIASVVTDFFMKIDRKDGL